MILTMMPWRKGLRSEQEFPSKRKTPEQYENVSGKAILSETIPMTVCSETAYLAARSEQISFAATRNCRS